MRIRQDAAFRQILNEARQFDVIAVERKGAAEAHPAVTKFIQFRAHFGVDEIAMFHRNITAMVQRHYHDGWIPHEKMTLNKMQTKTNLYFSSALGPSAIRAMQHMQSVQNLIAKMKHG